MFTDKQISTQPLDHLGLIAATVRELKLVEKIDSRIAVSKNKGSKVSMGQRVFAMILNGLGFIDDRLYMFPDFLGNKPIDRLLGENLTAQDFNDDTLGRCLDEIFNYGTTKLFSEIALELGIEQKLLGKSVHFDTSTISVYGDYEPSQKPSSAAATNEKDEINQPLNITYGYSKDHRQDLKQMVINLATTGAAGFPVWMEAHSGNASDKTIIQKATQKMKSFCDNLKEAPSFLYVGDSAMYENCVKKASGLKWLTRVPETLKEAKTIISRKESDFTWVEQNNGYRATSLTSNYGKVEQRWLLVFSKQACDREIKTLEKQIKREEESFKSALWHLSNQPFACEKDAQKAGKECIKKLKYHRVAWTLAEIAKRGKKGRPKKDAHVSSFEYFITGTLAQDSEQIELQKQTKGRFILATNELDAQKLGDDEMLPE